MMYLLVHFDSLSDPGQYTLYRDPMVAEARARDIANQYGYVEEEPSAVEELYVAISDDGEAYVQLLALEPV